MKTVYLQDDMPRIKFPSSPLSRSTTGVRAIMNKLCKLISKGPNFRERKYTDCEEAKKTILKRVDVCICSLL